MFRGTRTPASPQKKVLVTTVKLLKKWSVSVSASCRWCNAGLSAEKIYALAPRGLVTGIIHFVGSLIRAELSFS
jgi:hypothetical protein